MGAQEGRTHGDRAGHLESREGEGRQTKLIMRRLFPLIFAAATLFAQAPPRIVPLEPPEPPKPQAQPAQQQQQPPAAAPAKPQPAQPQTATPPAQPQTA